MKRLNIIYLLVTALWLLAKAVSAQVIITSPGYPVDVDSCTVFFDATQGNGELANVSPPIYAHTGVITNLSTSPSNWKYVVAGWTLNIPKTQMIPLGNNLYKLVVTPSIREYYGVPASEKILKMAFVFRNSDGSKVGRNSDGSDIFADVYPAYTSINIIQPDENNLLLSLNDTIVIEAYSPLADSLFLVVNNSIVKSVAGQLITDTILADNFGQNWMNHYVKIIAQNDTIQAADSFAYMIIPPPPVLNLPSGIVDGINYIDSTTVILSLYARGKRNCFVTGDFNDWGIDSLHYLFKTPDGNRFWVELNNLVPQKEYIFQYLVDGSLRIGDPYADKVSDPDDKYISDSTYPNLIPYPTGKTTGIATVLQTAQDPYPWGPSDFNLPDVPDLFIYEILIRDFTAKHDFPSLIDTLDYLKNLGVNAIELMPVMEFEGNLSWGYNPDFSFALDKYYGTKNSFKELVEAAHTKGIAVILDIVCNHHFGQSPLVRLYWDGSTQRPSTDNPWFNQIPKHPYNVGYDFNHESYHTKIYMERLIRYWIQEYHIDGYRFDLSKGFTQRNSYPNNVSLWGQYDQERINILKNYAGVIWSVKPESYVILEHFADNNEEIVLAADHMMLWGNMNSPYLEGAMGWNQNGKSDFSWASYQKRGWNEPNLVAYMESHDEERMMYKNITWGNASLPLYNIQDTGIGLKRVELTANFFFTIPGPKMIWQFGELGYDYSINWPTGASESRLAPKPVRWDYFSQWRRKYVYNIFASLAELKKTKSVFKTTNYTLNVSNAMKSIVLRDTSMDLIVIGNFNIAENEIIPNFTKTGVWYEFWTGDSITVTDVSAPISLKEGEYRMYTSKKLPSPPYIGIDDPFYNQDDETPFILFHPNPTSGSLTIESAEKELEITIFEPGGRVVLRTSLAESGQHTINVNHLSSGIYFIRFSAQGKLPYTGKVIKY